MFRKFAVIAAWFATLGIGVTAYGTIMERSTPGRQVVSHTSMVYPELAKRANLQGTVTLKVLVTADGKVKSVTPVNGNAILSQAAQTAVKQWQYAAGAEETITVEVTFAN